MQKLVLHDETNLKKTSAKGTKSLWRDVLSILSFQTISKPQGKKWNTKKRIWSEKIQLKLTLNFNITSNINCCQENQKTCPAQLSLYFKRNFRK